MTSGTKVSVGYAWECEECDNIDVMMFADNVELQHCSKCHGNLVDAPNDRVDGLETLDDFLMTRCTVIMKKPKFPAGNMPEHLKKYTKGFER